MAPDEGEELQLEAMRQKDYSWYPCRVSLCSGTLDSICMKVEFGSGQLEDMDVITTKEEAHAHLRCRSSSLEHGDCFHIEGVPVLAMNTTRGSLFFDAEVLKVKRVRHLNKGHCRCKVEIRWLHPELKGETATVSSSSIRKLSRRNIESHPTVAGFLQSINLLSESDLPLDVTLIGGSSEMDFHQLLQKQIEDISKLVDTSKSSHSEDILFKIKRADPGRDRQSNVFDSSNIGGKSLRRSPRIQNQLHVEVKKKDPHRDEITQEDNLECKLPMSPLAARAALASFVHESPVYHMKQEKVIMSPSKSTPGSDILRVECAHTLFNSQVCFHQKVLLNGELSTDIPIPVQAKGGKCGDKHLEKSQSQNSSKKVSITELDEDVVRNIEQLLPADEKKMRKKERDDKTITIFPEYGISENLDTPRRLTRSAAKKEFKNAICKSGELGSPEDKPVEQKNSLFSSVDLAGHAKQENSKSIDFSAPTIAITESEDTHEINEIMLDSTRDRRTHDLTTIKRKTCSSGQKERVCMIDKQLKLLVPKEKDKIKKNYLSFDETQQPMRRKKVRGSDATETVCSVCSDGDKKEVSEFQMGSAPKAEKQYPYTSMRLTRSAVQKEMKYLSRKTQEHYTSEDGGAMKKKSVCSHFGDETSTAQGFSKKKRMRVSSGHVPVFDPTHNHEVNHNVKTPEKLLVTSSLSSSDNHIPQRASDRRITRSQSKLRLEMGRDPTSACGGADYTTSTQSLPPDMNYFSAGQVKRTAGASQDTHKKKLNVLSLDVTHTFVNSTISIQENMAVTHELSSDWVGKRSSRTAKNRVYRNSMDDSLSKDRASKWSRVNKRLVRTPFGPEKQPSTENVNSHTAVAKFTRFVTDRRSNCTTVTTRITRSRLQKEMGNSIANIKLQSLRGEMKVESPTSQKKMDDSRSKIKTGVSSNRPKLTRLASQKEGNTLAAQGDTSSGTHGHQAGIGQSMLRQKPVPKSMPLLRAHTRAQKMSMESSNDTRMGVDEC